MPNKNVSTSPEGEEPTEGKPASTVSERKLKANQGNSKKSTGPKTARGKAHSRFNALKHGLLAKRVMCPDGKFTEPQLLELLESLREKYGQDDVRTELLLEGIVVDYWRQGMALQHEIKYVGRADWPFYPGSSHMPNFERYTTASVRRLQKNLQLLDQGLAEQPAVEEADAEPATDASTPEPDQPAAHPAPEGIPQAAQAEDEQVHAAAGVSAPAPQGPVPAEPPAKPVASQASQAGDGQGHAAAGVGAPALEPQSPIPAEPPVEPDVPQTPMAEGDLGSAAAGVSAPAPEPQGPASAEPPADPGVSQAA